MEAKKSERLETRKSELAAARQIVTKLKDAKVVNLDMRVSDVFKAIDDPLAEVAGYVLAWDKYVLVVGREKFEDIINPQIKM